MKRTITKTLIFSTLALLLWIASCKKSNNASVVPTNNNSATHNPALRMTGVWAVHGTHEYLSHGTTDTVNTTITIWMADDTTVVTYSNSSIFPGYSVNKLGHDSNSLYTFGDYTFDIKKDSLQYHYVHLISGNYQTVSLQSTSHSPFADSTITSNAAKMEGTRQWHGSVRTVYIPPWYTGLPDVDTTYYDPLSIRIKALSDTLIMAGFSYLGSSEVWQYLFLRKTFDDQSITVFSATKQYSNQSITYYGINNSMYYFDSSTIGPTVYKYYTP